MRALWLTLEVAGNDLQVAYRLDGVRFAADAVVAQLPVRVAGVPAIRLDDSDLEVADEEGPVGTWTDLGSADGAEDQVIRWHASRATRGAIRVAYRAAPKPSGITRAWPTSTASFSRSGRA